jgi:hypothetical protein
MIDILTKAEAKWKIVIAGNHDITLDEELSSETGRTLMHRSRAEGFSAGKEMWTGDKAKQAGSYCLFGRGGKDDSC